ncbi:F-box protein SKIP19 [Bienertia sinuspersici]
MNKSHTSVTTSPFAVPSLRYTKHKHSLFQLVHNSQMSSISSSHPNPNPNPNPQPSNSTKSKRKKKKSRNRKRNKNKNRKTPNWLELPDDVWTLILSKLCTIDIIENVQKVCMLFRKICKQPSMFKIVDMTVPDAYMHLPYDVNVMTRFIVDRSCGCLVDIYLEYVCDDDTLMYIVERSKNLKHLRVGHYIYISDEGLTEAVKKLPELEELEIIICSFSEDTIETIGHACPSLKSFSLNGVASKHRRCHKLVVNEEALAIAKSMPNLRKLQLIGSWMSNVGLKAVLDGCPLLESLDLRACFGIDLSGDLGKRCEKIKHLRLPCDSTADYGHEACTDNEGYLDACLDSDDSDMFGFCPSYDFWDFDDEFVDYFDDFDDFPLYYYGNGLLDYESSN